jgi:hypothetical protein
MWQNMNSVLPKYVRRWANDVIQSDLVFHDGCLIVEQICARDKQHCGYDQECATWQNDEASSLLIDFGRNTQRKPN